MHMSRRQRQLWDVDRGEIRIQVGAGSCDRAGDGPFALGLAGDLHGPRLERTFGAPFGLKRDGAVRVDPPGGADRSLVAVDRAATDLKAFRRIDRLDLYAGLGA